MSQRGGNCWRGTLPKTALSVQVSKWCFHPLWEKIWVTSQGCAAAAARTEVGTHTHKNTQNPKTNPPRKRYKERSWTCWILSTARKDVRYVWVTSQECSISTEKHFFFPFLQHYSVSARWYMLWLGTSKMLTNSYFFFDLPFFLYLTSSQTYTAFLLYQRWKIPSFYFSVRFTVWIFFIFYLFSCLTFRFWKSFYRHFSAFHL